MNKNVASTARMVAYYRTFSDIPYSQEIFDFLEGLHENDGLSEEILKPGLSPQFEARYKLINELLFQTSIKQVLEIAAGFSPRGMLISENPSYVFAEIDTQTIMTKKREFIDRLMPNNANLRLEEGDGLSYSDLKRATTLFNKDKPIAVINEGLMRYLNFDQKTTLANNIRQLLSRFGGAWITSDISLRKIQESENAINSDYIQKITKATGVDIVGNRFENEDVARKFFENLGFLIERHSFTEVDELLVSPERLGLSSADVLAMNGEAVVYVMRVSPCAE